MIPKKLAYCFVTFLLTCSAFTFSARVKQGPNNLQASPKLVNARLSTANLNLTVEGTLHSVANTQFLIQLFIDPAKRDDITEGKTFLGQFKVTTDTGGSASFKKVFKLLKPLVCPSFVSSTATRLQKDTPTDTSEFSPSIRIKFRCNDVGA